MNHPVNVCGVTSYYEHGLLECVYDGYGYRDEDGNITWYGDYNPPKNDKSHSTLVIPYGNGVDLCELEENAC